MVIEGMQGLVVRPGDTLLIALNRRLNDDEFADMRDRLRGECPQLDKVLFVEDVAALAVYRPDAS
jgi:hypothetical protein